VKYESWLKTNKQYKYNLISKLTQNQYNNFIYQFFVNKEQTSYILFKRLNVLFGCSKLKSYTTSELIKLNNIVSNNKLSLDLTIKLFDIFKTTNITEYNIDKLCLYIKDIENNFNFNIKWGPGNHKNIAININEHFKKHVLSEEGKYWFKILDKIDYTSYQKYAIDSFYKMKKVIIHTNGVDVYLSGFYGNIFIIGRYDNNIFGISSCYYVESGEKLGRYKGLCLQLS